MDKQQIVIALVTLLIGVASSVGSSWFFAWRSGNESRQATASIHRAISADAYLHTYPNAEPRYDAAGRLIGNFATAEFHAKGTSTVNAVGCDAKTDT